MGPGEHAVGGAPGLVLRVRESGHRSFVLRYRTPDRKQRSMNLGRYPEQIKLGAARDEAHLLLIKIRGGGDPVGERKAELEPKAKPTSLSDTVNAWIADAHGRLKQTTIDTYLVAVNHFLRWADGRVPEGKSLTRTHLSELRAHLISLPKQLPAASGKRGQRLPTAQSRGPVTVNRELRTLKTVLNSLRKAGHLPQLDRDAITDNLGAVPVLREEPEFLRHKAIQQLLRACDAHDAAMFRITRHEHAAGLEGGTNRHLPIKPFALFLLFTGCRRGEALALTWDAVDLDAVDDSGKVVGEIRLGADITKTRIARTIHMEVSPALRVLLLGLKGKPGERVFGKHTVGTTTGARKLLQSGYKAPQFTWQLLRSTCGTYLTNASGIFGAATVYLSARQLGHSVKVAEHSYLGVIRGIPDGATTLEVAMRIDDLC